MPVDHLTGHSCIVLRKLPCATEMHTLPDRRSGLSLASSKRGEAGASFEPHAMSAESASATHSAKPSASATATPSASATASSLPEGLCQEDIDSFFSLVDELYEDKAPPANESDAILQAVEAILGDKAPAEVREGAMNMLRHVAGADSAISATGSSSSSTAAPPVPANTKALSRKIEILLRRFNPTWVGKIRNRKRGKPSRAKSSAEWWHAKVQAKVQAKCANVQAKVPPAPPPPPRTASAAKVPPAPLPPWRSPPQPPPPASRGPAAPLPLRPVVPLKAPAPGGVPLPAAPGGVPLPGRPKLPAWPVSKTTPTAWHE